MSGEHVFDVASFRLQFPAFADETKYPEPTLSGYFTMATLYIYPLDWCLLKGDALQLALNLMTAHLTYLNTLLMAGNTTVGIVTGATISKVTVSLQAPPIKSGWQQWLALSPYGMQLWALLSVKSAGGFYVGGSCERAGFRGAGGRFR